MIAQEESGLESFRTDNASIHQDQTRIMSRQMRGHHFMGGGKKACKSHF